MGNGHKEKSYTAKRPERDHRGPVVYQQQEYLHSIVSVLAGAGIADGMVIQFKGSS